jgi:hypothetical protein
VLLGPNLNLPKGQVLAQRRSDSRWFPFDPTATDGRQNPRKILKRATVTDAQGRPSNYTVPNFGINCARWTAVAYSCGEFNMAELVGDLDYMTLLPGVARVLEGYTIPGGGSLPGDAGKGILKLL